MFIAGVNDSEKLFSGVNDTGEKSAVSLTLVNSFSAVSLTPAINF
jgi:hypothetical protein